MQEMRGGPLPDDRKRTEVHQGGSVTVQAPDGPFGMLHGDPQGDHSRVAHGTDGQEIPGMVFSALFTQLKELPGEFPGCRNDDIACFRFTQDDFRGRFAAHAEGIGIGRLPVGRQRAFTDDDRRGPAVGEGGNQGSKAFAEGLVGRVFGENQIGDVQDLQLRERDDPLFDMLGFVLDAGFPAPADDQQAWDSVYLGVHQGGQRVYGVSQAAVLHIAEGRLSAGKVVSGAQGDRAAFIMGDDVGIALRPETVVEFVAQSFQQGIGDTGKEADACFFTGIE